MKMKMTMTRPTTCNDSQEGFQGAVGATGDIELGSIVFSRVCLSEAPSYFFEFTRYFDKHMHK